MRALPLLCALASACTWITKEQVEERFDLDGDGVARPEDCDDLDPTVGVIRFYIDGDGDGFGRRAYIDSCTPGEGMALQAGDCDDVAPLIFPGADERCNSIDDDCDGVVDDDSIDEERYWPDIDGDGYGRGGEHIWSCPASAPENTVDNNSDCDDDNAEVGEGSTFYADWDWDGYGDPDETMTGCVPNYGYIDRAGDCEPEDAEMHPEAVEICDPEDVDENCNGYSDDEEFSRVITQGPVGTEVEVQGTATWYPDEDGDGMGYAWDEATGDTLELCDGLEGYVKDNSDCDPGEAGLPSDLCELRSISAGDSTTCVLRTNGRMSCWGEGSLVEDLPAEAEDLPFQAVALGQAVACALGMDGALSCWGDLPGLDRPELSSGTYLGLSAEGGQICALSDVGRITCWGDSITYSVDVPEAFAQLDAGTSHVCGITDDGDTICVGACPGTGECADPTSNFLDVAVGTGFSCGLDYDGFTSRLTCWSGGGGASVDLVVPYWTSIYAYERTLCGLTNVGQAHCVDVDPGTGDGFPTIPAPSATSISTMSTGNGYACGIKTGGPRPIVECWMIDEEDELNAGAEAPDALTR